MPTIAVSINAGDELCECCPKLGPYGVCEVFGFAHTLVDEKSGDSIRLLSCKEAEAQIKKLVEAAREGIHRMSKQGDLYNLDDLAEALKPFEED